LQLTDRQGHEREVREWSREAYSMTVKAVCGECNNGWMSALEQRASVLLRPMLRGGRRKLDGHAQRTLAAWALKTAMMVEHTQNGLRRVFPADEYRHLRERGEPSDRVYVWLTTYSGDRPAYAHLYGADADTTQHPERGVRDLFGVTVAVGPVVVYVFGTTIPEADRVTLAAPAVVRVHPLWPCNGTFVWSPSPGFDDEELFAFSDATYQGWASSM